MPDQTLSGLIDQNHVARETFYIRRRLEFSPDRWESATTLHTQTETAERAWEKAELALWIYRASIDRLHP